MWRRRLLPILGTAFVLMGGVQVAAMVDLSAAQAAAPATAGLLAGCTDIPEAVALSDLLASRSAAITRYQQELDKKKAEIALAEGTLTSKLRQLKAVRDAGTGHNSEIKREVSDDIDRLVGVYDAMKPRDAAAVLANLPPDFAAEILMRVDPGTGAQILASVEPAQAAILTTHMGARRVRSN
ncbi:hypothetical protein DRW48_04415 [Paracoccus suum]|uniref:Uncharacterized protein n=1 Tax=Paracoccus suum TaxID=2259340 RepID=A0A344PI28_9RHOB|nr:MotE family protein [Paracoccus suum]AXC49033.1 hypothetical protein DRW48_04415 [Paracoccus suum]